MATAIAVLAGLLGLGGLIAGMVYWMRTAASNAVSVDQLTAAAKVEAERSAVAEKAASDQRAARLDEFNAKAAAVSTPNDAAELLRAATAAGGSKR